MIDYEILRDAYKNNKDFKDYIDRYCVKHKKETQEALKDKVASEYYGYITREAEDEE